MILVVSSIALSLPRWQSSDSRATKINSDREGRRPVRQRTSRHAPLFRMQHMPHGTLRTPINQDQPIPTLIRQRQSQRLGDGRLDCLATLSRRLRKPTRACSVKRDRFEVKPMAHMVLLASPAARRWRLASPRRPAWKEAGRRVPQVLRDAPAWVWIYRREWAALSIVS